MESTIFQQMVENGIHKPCRFLNVEHHVHSPLEKSIIERTIQYIKDRTECFDDYFPCTRINCRTHNELVGFICGHAQ
jgi:hypothetical protein